MPTLRSCILSGLLLTFLVFPAHAEDAEKLKTQYARLESQYKNSRRHQANKLTTLLKKKETDGVRQWAAVCKKSFEDIEELEMHIRKNRAIFTDAAKFVSGERKIWESIQSKGSDLMALHVEMNESLDLILQELRSYKMREKYFEAQVAYVDSALEPVKALKGAIGKAQKISDALSGGASNLSAQGLALKAISKTVGFIEKKIVNPRLKNVVRWVAKWDEFDGKEIRAFREKFDSSKKKQLSDKMQAVVIIPAGQPSSKFYQPFEKQWDSVTQRSEDLYLKAFDLYEEDTDSLVKDYGREMFQNAEMLKGHNVLQLSKTYWKHVNEVLEVQENLEGLEEDLEEAREKQAKDLEEERKRIKK